MHFTLKQLMGHLCDGAQYRAIHQKGQVTVQVNKAWIFMMPFNCITFHISGRACDQCKDGFFGLDIHNPNGCMKCSCDFIGSFNSSCDPSTGQCYCAPFARGANCDACNEGYYTDSVSH